MLKRKPYWSSYTSKLSKNDNNNRFKKIKFFLITKNKSKSKFYLPKIKLCVNKNAYIKLEKDITSRINNNVDFFFKNRYSVKSNIKLSQYNYFSIINKKKMSISALFFFLRKNKILFGFGRKKQFLFNLFETFLCLREDFWMLISREFFNNYFSVLSIHKELSFFFPLKNFLNWNLFNTLVYTTDVPSKLFITSNNVYMRNIYYLIFYFNNKVTLKNWLPLESFTFFLSFQENSLQKYVSKLNVRNFSKVTVTYNKLLNQYLYLSIFKGRNINILKLKKNNYFLNYIDQNLISPKLNLSRYLWKRSFMFNKKFYSKKRNFGWGGKHTSYNREISKSILFLFSKLQEKEKSVSFYNNLANNSEIKIGLNKLKSVLIYVLKNKIKQKKTQTMLLSTLSFVKALNKKKWSSIYANHLLKNFQNLEEFQQYSKKIQLKVDVGKKSEHEQKNHLVSAKSNFVKVRNLRKKALWAEKKLVQKNISIISPKFKQINKFFSFIFKTNTTIYFINALALTKFSFVFPEKKKSVQKFLNQIEREMIERYKYIAVYIQDLVRVSFLSLFLKKPTFLATFIAFQMAKLPRNRKETKLTRFIIKVVKIFSSQRKEMVGMKIEFKGRVNRWRRTKIIRGVSGVLPLYSYETRIEFGSSKAITRKGALGIRLWFCYNPVFEKILRASVLNYLQYSQHLRTRSVKHFLIKFKHKN